jgi:hypothetical protein
MARIELKNTTIRLRDGYSNTAAVNQASDAPAAGDNTFVIDTLGTSGVIPVSAMFTVAGADKRYTVTASDANAILEIDLDDASAGTFTISVAGNASSAIAFGATQAQIQTAVDAITGVDAGDFLVTKVAELITVKAVTSGQFGNTAVTLAFDGALLTATAETGTQTQPGGVTYGITFTPVLATADGLPVDGAAIAFSGRSLEVKVGDGNLEFTENRNFTYDLDRGRLDTVRQGDEAPMDVTLDFVWENLTALPDVDTPTIEDVLHKRGAAADWESSSDDPCEPFCIDIEIEYVPPCGETGTEFITLPEFRWATLPHSIGDAQISMTGQCNATEALVSRSAA